MRVSITLVLLHLFTLSFGQEQWQQVGSEFYCYGGCPAVDDVTEWKGELYASGNIFRLDGLSANIFQIVKWDGVRWNNVGGAIFDNGGSTAVIYKMFGTSDNLYVCGKFESMNGDATFGRIARWDGCMWHSIGGGIDNSEVRDIFAIDPGNVYIGGNFTNAGGNTQADKVAHWDGTNWNALDGGGSNRINNGYVNALFQWNGDLFVGGSFGVHSLPDQNGDTYRIDEMGKWTGTEWVSLLSDPECDISSGIVQDIEVLNNEMYIIGGLHYGCPSNHHNQDIIRYNGNALFDVGANGDFITGIPKKIILHNNKLIIAGTFGGGSGSNIFEYIAELNGNMWEQFGTPLNIDVRSVATFDGVLYAGGIFQNANGNPAIDRIAKWDALEPPKCGGDSDIFYIDSILATRNTGYFEDAFDNYHYYKTERTVCNSSSSCDLNQVWNFYKNDIRYQLPTSKGLLPNNNRLNTFSSLFDDFEVSPNSVPIGHCEVNHSEAMNIRKFGKLLYDSPGTLVNIIPGCGNYYNPCNVLKICGGYTFDLTNDPIITVIDEDNYTVYNYTQEGHIFYPGMVIRQLKEECGEVKIATIGKGFHACTGPIGEFFSWLNETEGLKLFNQIDSLLITEY